MLATIVISIHTIARNFPTFLACTCSRPLISRNDFIYGRNIRTTLSRAPNLFPGMAVSKTHDDVARR
jgi:hypothetical protein